MDSIKETYEHYMKSEERKKTLENAPVEFTVLIYNEN